MQKQAKNDQASQQMPIGPAAKYLGVSRDTLRRWEKSGKLKSVRTPTNRRLYSKNSLDAILQGKNQPVSVKTKPTQAPVPIVREEKPAETAPGVLSHKEQPVIKSNGKPEKGKQALLGNPIFIGIISFIVTIIIGVLLIFVLANFR